MKTQVEKKKSSLVKRVFELCPNMNGCVMIDVEDNEKQEDRESLSDMIFPSPPSFFPL